MYLKAEIPGGLFRIFDEVTDLVIPKNHSTVCLPFPKRDTQHDVESAAIPGFCWRDAVSSLDEQTKHAVAHVVGRPDVEGVKTPDYVEFIMIDRTHCAYHSLFIFNDKNKVPTILCTQWPVYVCNDSGKTIERFGHDR